MIDVFKALALIGLLIAPQVAAAQGYPSQPIKLLVPSAAGSGSDVIARVLAERMSASLKQPVVIDNRTGAGGMIAAETVAKSPPDGYTLFACTSSTMVTAPLVTPRVGYDPVRDLTPIAMLGLADNIIVVPATSKFQKLGDLIAYAKANPGKLTYGTAGVGTTAHLAAEMLAQQAGIDIVHAPYKGTPLAETDLITGRLDFMINNTAPAVPNVRAGKTRVLAVTAKTRSAELPDTPTTLEAGLQDFEVYGFVALCGPANLPKPMVDRLNSEVNAALAVPAIRTQMTKLGIEPSGGTPDDLRNFVRAEIVRWGKVIKDRNLKFE